MKLSVSILAFLTAGLLAGSKAQEATFTNPILDGNSADPCILKLGGFYYLTLSEAGESELTVYKSSVLTNFRDAEKTIAYKTQNGERDLWAAEMHLIEKELYIYFTMDRNGYSHHMYAVKAENASNPMGNWSDAIRLMPEWEHESNSAIDGTVMQHGNGRLYFVFASNAYGLHQSLWITPMKDAVTTEESKLLLREPKSEWEAQGGLTCEGAFFMYKNNMSYMVFSAGSTYVPDYSLGLMSIPSDKDPMNPSHWNYGEDRPVFWRNDDEDVYTTGHAAFTVSPDETETWMVYHGTVNTTHINGFRIARLEKIDWDENGPIFPRPHGFQHPQPVPSGQVY